MNATHSSAPAPAAKGLRVLAWNELVRRGDFVKAGQRGFQLWEGPAGFRADAFIQTIYRKLKSRTAGAGKAP